MTLSKLGLGICVAASLFGAETIPGAGGGLIAHEWGTFTSVANADGTSIPWAALGGTPDLPCFVIRPNMIFKYVAFSRVRMETPVVYFYAPRRMTVSLDVQFRQGRITEWYPEAATTGAGLKWKDVELRPGEPAELPSGKGPSHYYAARETDAAPLRVGTQQEKLLFYRGVGDFQVPLLPTFTAGGEVRIRNADRAILFENRGGRIGYRVVTGPDAVAPPELTGDVTQLHALLVEMLSEAGLYPKEARAMVETWRDSWFEEGMRVLYLLPRETVDAVLPLNVSPQPQELARVFVGRVELLSPAMRATIGRAMADSDIPTLQRYGRFLNAFAAQMPRPENARAALAFLQQQQDAALHQVGSPGCVQ